MLAERIQRARQANGLSQRALAEKVGLSAMTICKYEKGKSTPASNVLLDLADALGVRTEYFSRTKSVNLEPLEQQGHQTWKLPQSAKCKILADAQDQMERWLALEELAPAPWAAPFSLPSDLPSSVSELDMIEPIANRIRQHWKLGLNPIPDLVDTLESRGVTVLTTWFDDSRFEGMSACAGQFRVVIIGLNWPGDRQRFTLAHELGHLVLDNRLAESVNKEQAVNRFARAFLVPQQKVIEVLGERRRSLESLELHLLKHEFGLSMSGWLQRALETKVVSMSTYRQLASRFKAKGWDKKEPGMEYPSESPRLFKHAVYRALGESHIGEPKAAELLGIPAGKLAAQRRMEPSDVDTCS